ncbi:MAG: MarR family winged helix-turn-helix transcriptional regulator [Candidatus Diapherotrites archaeon]|nr:MarR family winged helix-turn-helix transcriptional regulator [Candidatus Diapherotrites archaeon]MDZ4256430.1 MarR family winged helix-turn-helix transcriptional regulator [archaeon]
MQILESLIRPNNPTDLAKRLHSHRPTVSMVIQDLQAKHLVKRLNPEEKNVSIYTITPEGARVLKAVQSMRYAADEDK